MQEDVWEDEVRVREEGKCEEVRDGFEDEGGGYESIRLG